MCLSFAVSSALAASMPINLQTITAPPVLQETPHGRWCAQVTSILYETSDIGDSSWESVNVSWTSTVGNIPTLLPEATHIQSRGHVTSPHISLVVLKCACVLVICNLFFVL